MSLNKKAKTAEQIYDEIDEFYITSVYRGAWTDVTKGMTYREFVKLKEAKWVKLEDAKQELTKLKQKLRKFPCYNCVFFSKKDCQSQITCSYQMFLSWFKNEKFEELLKEEQPKHEIH
jgi:hypothetical protein